MEETNWWAVRSQEPPVLGELHVIWHHHRLVTFYLPLSSTLEKMMRDPNCSWDVNECLGCRRRTEPEIAGNSAWWKTSPIEMWGVCPFKLHRDTSIKPPLRRHDNRRCHEANKMGPPKILWGSWAFAFSLRAGLALGSFSIFLCLLCRDTELWGLHFPGFTRAHVVPSPPSDIVPHPRHQHLTNYVSEGLYVLQN